MNEQKMREEFEVWANGPCGPAVFNGGVYCDHDTLELLLHWMGVTWQAALSTKQQAGEPVGYMSRTAVADLMNAKDVPATISHDRFNHWQVPIYTAPQLPRDVLMRVARAAVSACGKASVVQGPAWGVDVAAIVDAALPVAKQGAFLDVVFDGPPSHESGRFVEVEDSAGRSVNAGSWIDRGDGLWALRIGWCGKTQPEPVNQQMLAALKRLAAKSRPVAAALYNIGQQHENWNTLSQCIAELDSACRHGYAAITAAESAQAQQPQAVGVPEWLTWDRFRDSLAIFVSGACQNPARDRLTADNWADVIDEMSEGRGMFNAMAHVRAMLAAAPKPEGQP